MARVTSRKAQDRTKDGSLSRGKAPWSKKPEKRRPKTNKALAAFMKKQKQK